MLPTPCIYQQLELQKLLILQALEDNLKEELLKIAQISMVQKTIAPTHNPSSCPDCLASKLFLFPQTNPCPMANESDFLKSSLEGLCKEMKSFFSPNTEASPFQIFLNKEESQNTKSLMGIQSNDEEVLEPREKTEGSGEDKVNTTARIEAAVPKVDRMKYLGFKPQMPTISPKKQLKTNKMMNSADRFKDSKRETLLFETLIKQNLSNLTPKTKQPAAPGAQPKTKGGFSLKEALRKYIVGNDSAGTVTDPNFQRRNMNSPDYTEKSTEESCRMPIRNQMLIKQENGF